MIQSILKAILNRFEHGDYIIDRGITLYVMDRIEYKSIFLTEYPDSLFDLFIYFPGSAERKGLLGIDSAAPENNVLAVFFHQRPGVHPRR